MKKIKVLVSGYYGKMGETICRLIKQSTNFEVLYGFDKTIRELSDCFVITDLDNISEESILPDVIIDFSAPAATMKLVDFAQKFKIPIVVATTDLGVFGEQKLQEASKTIPVFQSANMSYAVCLLKKVLQMIAPRFTGVDIEIEERHHNRKKDAPSGTAKMLANAINESLGNEMKIVYGRTGKREANEIGISSSRLGNVVGDHTVLFANENEFFEIKHSALSRDLFADGALKAAEFLLSEKEPGLYTMDDLM